MWSSKEIIRELHKIREELYKERKGMDPKKEIKLINSSVDDVEKKQKSFSLNIKFIIF